MLGAVFILQSLHPVANHEYLCFETGKACQLMSVVPDHLVIESHQLLQAAASGLLRMLGSIFQRSTPAAV
jgi:hypothetical protein